MTTNIIDMPWLNAEYLDGTEKLIGIREAFSDAKKIKTILPPVFRGEKCYLYRMVTMKLLTTIVMSAYYKEETGFASKTLEYTEDLKNNGLYSDVIKDYLDKWYDRFDLYSETHPFLQNIALKEVSLEDFKNHKFLAWSPYAPSNNSKVFGKIRSVDESKDRISEQYEMSKEEFTYFLIYMAIVGRKSGKGYEENALMSQAYIFLELNGNNLAEIILNNVVSLENSSAPDEYNDDVFADKPVWEFDSISEINNIDPAVLSNNTLLCTFFPGISLLCVEKDENDKPAVVIRIVQKHKSLVESKKTINPKLSDKLSGLYKDYSSIVTNKGYCRFKLAQNKAFALCLLATEYLDGNLSCRVLEEKVKDNANGVNIYFRELDNYYAPTGTTGVFKDVNMKTLAVLKDVDKHKIAEKYQDYYKTTRIELSNALNRVYDYKKTDSNNKDSFIETVAKKELSDYIEEDFFGKFTEDLIEDEDAFENAIDRMIKKAEDIFDKHVKNMRDIYKIEKSRNNMLMNLRMEKKKKTKKTAKEKKK